MSSFLNNLKEHIEHFPLASHQLLLDISEHYVFVLKMRKKRATKLGDFRYPRKGEVPQITLNIDPNYYRTLITFLHELAHLIVFIDEGRSRNPHGPKWKKRFAQLLDIFLTGGVFPQELQASVGTHIIKPKASSHADIELYKALRLFDPESSELLLIDLEENQLFKLNNGRVFKKGVKRRSRILCIEIATKRNYLIHSHAEVFPVQ